MLKIKCDAVLDWNGTWYRPEIKEEMKDLGIRSDLGEWPYIFDRVFDQGVNGKTVETIAEMFESGIMVDTKLMINGNVVRIWQV